MVEADKIIQEADQEREIVYSLLPEAAEFFHEYEGEMFERREAIQELSNHLDVEERIAGKLVSGLVADEVDPVVQVSAEGEKYVGVIDYEKHGFYYSFTDWDDVDEDREIGVCVQCVKEEEFDQDVFRVEGADEKLLKEHLEQEHNLSPAEVETGAKLLSGTTIAGNLAFHKANENAEGLNADQLHGFHASHFVNIEDPGEDQEYLYDEKPAGQILNSISSPSNDPYGVDQDSSGCIWVADSTEQKIYKMTQTPQPSFIGQIDGPDFSLHGADFDSNESIWVADLGGTVYKIDQSGNYISDFSTPSDDVEGVGVDSNECIWFTDNFAPGLDTSASDTVVKSDQSGNIAASFQHPDIGDFEGLGIDSDDCVWVSDLNADLYKFNQSGSLIESIFIGDIFGVALDPDDCIWYTTSGESIYKINQNGEAQSQFQTQISGANGIGISSSKIIWYDTGDDSLYKVKPDSKLVRSFTSPGGNPTGLGIDSNDCIWNSDSSSNSIYKVDPFALGDVNSALSSPSNLPTGVAVDSKDSIWNADTSADSIYELDKSGSVINEFSSPDSGPRGLGIDSSGCLWHTDANNSILYRLKRYAEDSQIAAPSSDPKGLDLDSNGCIWHTDQDSNSIYKLRKDGSVISQFKTPEANSDGNDDFNEISVDSSDSILLFSDWDHCLYKIDQTGSETASSPIIQANGDSGIAVAPSTGNIWSADGSDEEIYEQQTDGTTVNSFSVLSETDFPQAVVIDTNGCVWTTAGSSGDEDNILKYDQSGSLQDSFSMPYNEALDLGIDRSTGCLWYIDESTLSIYRFPQSGRLASQFSISGSDPHGVGVNQNTGSIWFEESNSLYSYNSSGTQQSVIPVSGSPKGVAVNSNGCIWVADDGSGNIIELDRSGSVLQSFSAPSSGPRGLGFDSNSTLWHSDDNNSPGSIYRIGVDERVDASFSAPGGTPEGLAVDTDTGCLWHADSSTLTIYKLDQAGNAVTGSSFSTPSSTPKGVGVDDSNCIWHADGSNAPGSIYRLNRSGTTQLQFETPSSGAQGVGISPGGSLWHADETTDRIYQVSKDATVRFDLL